MYDLVLLNYKCEILERYKANEQGTKRARIKNSWENIMKE